MLASDNNNMHLLPFDSHNHVHLGSTSPFLALYNPTAVAGNTIRLLQQEHDDVHPSDHPKTNETNNNNDNNSCHTIDQLLLSPSNEVAVSGMAIMSTNPRDYKPVKLLAKKLADIKPDNLHLIPCFGVHPWWLHELTEYDWEVIDDTTNKDNGDNSPTIPRWVYELQQELIDTPNSIVGETGLDGFHYQPNTKQLTSSIEQQIKAFKHQMLVAYKLQRPVSIHVVQSFGPLLDVLQDLKKLKKLPPVLYFHAFGGKIGTVDQILAILGMNERRKKNIMQQQSKETTASSSGNPHQHQYQVYFGFAPVINFRSPKTKQVIQHIGLGRIVLETDQEESILIPTSIVEGIEYLADAFDTTTSEIIHQTTQNAYDLYRIR